MMRNLLALAILPLLAGCQDVSTALVPPYIPEPIHIFDHAQYEADVAECRAAGARYKPHFSFGSVASAAVSGATSDTSLIPFNAAVPIYGAAGGAVGATANGLDIMSGQHANVFRNCLRDETRRDRSAIVADPRN